MENLKKLITILTSKILSSFNGILKIVETR